MTNFKPSENEDEYFARRDAELMRQQRAVVEHEKAEAERRTHFMKCPKCGYALISAEWRGVQIEQCPHCLGLWFDPGEAEKALSGPTGGMRDILNSLIAGFRRAKAGDR